MFDTRLDGKAAPYNSVYSVTKHFVGAVVFLASPAAAADHRYDNHARRRLDCTVRWRCR